jgi:hypothetical protein
MAGKMRGRWPPKEGLPTPAKLIDVEIAQARNLNVQRISVWRRRADADASAFSSCTVCCTDLASAVANPDWAVICFVTFDRAVFDASLTAERAAWRDLPTGLFAGFDIEILHSMRG